jgi:hypothetical protein
MKSSVILLLAISAISAVSYKFPKHDLLPDIKSNPLLKSKVQSRLPQFRKCVAKGGLEAAQAAAPAILAAVVAKFTGRKLNARRTFSSFGMNNYVRQIKEGYAHGKANAKSLACKTTKSQAVSQCVSFLKGKLSQAKGEILKKFPSVKSKYDSVMVPCLGTEIRVTCQTVADHICKSKRRLVLFGDIKSNLVQLKSKVQARSLEFGKCAAKGGLEAAKAAAPAILAAVVAKFTGRRLGLFNKLKSTVKNASSAIASGAAAVVSLVKPLVCGAVKSEGVSQCVTFLKSKLSQAKDEVLKKCPSVGSQFESVMLPCLETEVQVACQAVADEICPTRRRLAH